jgi:hypothetical protein
MRKKLRWSGPVMLVALLALPLGGGPTRGQPPARTPGKSSRPADKVTARAGQPTQPARPLASIEEMLARALKYNPDIRLAEAKLRDDEAELNRARLRVMQRIIAVHHALQGQRAEVERTRSALKRADSLVRSSALQKAARDEAQQDLTRARARLAELEAELPYLLGQGNEGLAEETIRTEFQVSPSRPQAEAIRPVMALRLRKALDQPIKADYKEVTLDDFLRDLGSKASGVVIHRNLALADLGGLKFGMRLGEVPLGSALLALQDTVPGLRVVARNYGILVTWEHQVPLGAVRLFDFWKSAGK